MCTFTFPPLPEGPFNFKNSEIKIWQLQYFRCKYNLNHTIFGLYLPQPISTKLSFFWDTLYYLMSVEWIFRYINKRFSSLTVFLPSGSSKDSYQVCCFQVIIITCNLKTWSYLIIFDYNHFQLMNLINFDYNHLQLINLII